MKVVCDHDWGFFSCCSMRLRAINRHCVEHGIYPEVDSSLQWTSFKDSPEQDMASILFDVPRRVGTAAIREPIGDLEEPTPTWFQYDDYGLIDYATACDLVAEYFHPSAAVFAAQADIESRYGIDPDRSLAACYRGSDKRSETSVPDHQEFVDAVEQRKKVDGRSLRVVLQTDEEEMIRFVRSKGLNWMIFRELPTTTRSGKAVHYSLAEGSRVQFSIKFLAICQTLSRCRRIVLNSGNVGAWLCLYRGSAAGVSQYRNGVWLDNPEKAA